MNTLSVMIVAATFAVAMPVAAQAADPTAPCAESSEYTRLGLSGVHEDVTPSSTLSWPYIVLDEEGSGNYPEESAVRFRYRVDVSGSSAKPLAQTADVRIALSWDNTSDYDLYVYDGNGELLSAGDQSNILAVGPGELVFLPQVPHCTDLQVDIVNYLGLPTSEMALDTTLGDLE